MELMSGGNLHEYLTRNSLADENITIRKLIWFYKEIASGYLYLHDNQILHENLATRNVLLGTFYIRIPAHLCYLFVDVYVFMYDVWLMST